MFLNILSFHSSRLYLPLYWVMSRSMSMPLKSYALFIKKNEISSKEVTTEPKLDPDSVHVNGILYIHFSELWLNFYTLKVGCIWQSVFAWAVHPRLPLELLMIQSILSAETRFQLTSSYKSRCWKRHAKGVIYKGQMNHSLNHLFHFTD